MWSVCWTCCSASVVSVLQELGRLRARPSVDLPLSPPLVPLHFACLHSFISRSLSTHLSAAFILTAVHAFPHPSTCLLSHLSISPALSVADRWRHAGGVKDQLQHK